MPDWLIWTLSIGGILVLYGTAWSATSLSGREMAAWTLAIVAILFVFFMVQQATGFSGIGLTACIVGLISALITFGSREAKEERLPMRIGFSLLNGGLLVGGTVYAILSVFA